MRSWRFAVMVTTGLITAAAGAQIVPVVTAPYRLAAMPAEGLGGAGQSAEAPVNDDLFAGTKVFEKNASDIQEITMDPETLDMVGGHDKEKARNMVLDVVRTYTYDKPGMYNMADVDAIRNRLNTGDWHCSVHTRDLKTGESTDVCARHRTDGLHETAIITVEPKQLTFIHVIRRGNGPGSSELIVLPLLQGVGPLPMMAMMDPDVFAQMQLGLHAMPMMNLRLDEQLKVLNSPAMQKEFEMKQKQFEIMRKQFGTMQKQLKNIQPVPQPAPSVPESPKP